MRTITRLLAALALLPLVSGCAAPAPEAPDVEGIVVHSLDGQVLADVFSLQAGEGVLRVLYPDRETFSLSLLTVPVLPGAREPSVDYLDRLSVPDDPRAMAGNQVLLLDAGVEDVFYVDRSSTEEEPVTKWVSRAAGQTGWWIDVLPYGGQLLAALPDEGSEAGSRSIRLYFTLGAELRTATTSGAWQPRQVLSPFRQRGRVSPVADLDGFVVYEGYSDRLLLIGTPGGHLSTREVYRGGEVHEAAAGPDGTLAVILFDSGAGEILLLEGQAWGDGRMEATPVTPSRGTSAVYATKVEGKRLFLFDERRLDDPKGRYALSLLIQRAEGYAKRTVLRGLAAPLDFEAATVGGSLWVLFDNQGGLELLELPLEAVWKSASSGS